MIERAIQIRVGGRCDLSDLNRCVSGFVLPKGWF